MDTTALISAFERSGYVQQHPQSVRAPDWDTTLFVSGGVQNWHGWALDEAAAGGARVGAQWCVRTNRLGDDSDPAVLTSFCMISAVRHGYDRRADAIAESLAALAECGVERGQLAFVATSAQDDRPADGASVTALGELGIAADRIGMRARRWAQPFRPIGPTGPNLFVLAETGPPCSPGCSPTCDCGRFLPFWNCEFLDHIRRDGRIVPASAPLCDSAGSLERLACAVTGERDPLRVEPLRSAAAAVREVLGGVPIGAADLALLVDHGRTVVLLNGSGIVPGARGHGHVLRRLLRRALAVLTGLGIDPRMIGPVSEAAATGSRGLPGFPEPAAIDLDGEVAAFRAALDHGRRRFDRAYAAAADPAELADIVFAVKASAGVPLPVLLAWCRTGGREPSAARVAELLDGERRRSRSTGFRRRGVAGDDNG